MRTKGNTSERIKTGDATDFVRRSGGMTIGVAASGHNAGAAVRAAVLGAELLGHGAIGGFAVFAVMNEEGAVNYRVTQRGGITALALPEEWLHARRAAVISSGPDRPEPLVQFLPSISGAGMVTGHRSPHLPGQDGIAVNKAVLARMVAGDSPQQAVDAVLAANPEADAGMIAMDINGQMGWGDSARVTRRGDQGRCHRHNDAARIVILHNSIDSQISLAESLADLAWICMTGERSPTRFLYLRESIPIRASDRDRIHIGPDGVIHAIDSADPLIPTAQRACWAIYRGGEVWQDDQQVGHVVAELKIDIAQGQVCKSLGGSPVPVVMKEDQHLTR